MADPDHGLGTASSLRRHQIRGPYSLWEHTHTFESDGPEATIIEDRVRYSIPFGPLGELADRLLVQRDLRQIFDHRHDAVARAMSRSS